MTKFYVDNQGRYIGGFDGAEPPDGAIEVPNPPDHGDDKLVDGAWVAATPIVPESVAMWQARAVMIEEGILDAVLTYVAAITNEIERKKAQAKLEYSSTVRRDDPLVLYVIPALGKTEAQIDAMFIRAAAL